MTRTRAGAGGLTVTIGVLVGLVYVLAKLAVARGVHPFTAFYGEIVVSAAVLTLVLLARRVRPVVNRRYLAYYLIGGAFGMSVPNIIAFAALRHVPAGLFTIVITLSPLLTFVVASAVQRRFLPGRKLFGVGLGLAGVLLATAGGASPGGAAATWLLVALVVPLSLAGNNVFRNLAYPAGADPLALAAGTLASQALVLAPVWLLGAGSYAGGLDPAAGLLVAAMGLLIAIGLVLTFELQTRTDGLGTSQIGYFITLTGVVLGALWFDESIGYHVVAAIALVFIGLRLTTGRPRQTPTPCAPAPHTRGCDATATS